MFIESYPIMVEISQHEYEKAYQKYVKHTGDIYGELMFYCDYEKRPLYKSGCGIFAMINGEGVIEYKYYKNTHKNKHTLICSESEIPLLKQEGLIK